LKLLQRSEAQMLLIRLCASVAGFPFFIGVLGAVADADVPYVGLIVLAVILVVLPRIALRPSWYWTKRS
jgi:hypothetical protein